MCRRIKQITCPTAVTDKNTTSSTTKKEESPIKRLTRSTWSITSKSKAEIPRSVCVDIKIYIQDRHVRKSLPCLNICRRHNSLLTVAQMFDHPVVSTRNFRSSGAITSHMYRQFFQMPRLPYLPYLSSTYAANRNVWRNVKFCPRHSRRLRKSHWAESSNTKLCFP